MAALIVGMAVMAVMMTVGHAGLEALAQREKEEELVFRGEQIAHAIGMFQRGPRTPTRRASTCSSNRSSCARGTRTDHQRQTSCRSRRRSRTGRPAGRSAWSGGKRQQQGRPAQGAAATAPVRPLRQAGAAVGGIIGVTSKSTDINPALQGPLALQRVGVRLHAAGSGAAGAGGAGAPGGAGSGPGPGKVRQPTAVSGHGGHSRPAVPGTGAGAARGPGGPGGQIRAAARRSRSTGGRTRTLSSRRVKTTTTAIWL